MLWSARLLVLKFEVPLEFAECVLNDDRGEKRFRLYIFDDLVAICEIVHGSMFRSAGYWTSYDSSTVWKFSISSICERIWNIRKAFVAAKMFPRLTGPRNLRRPPFSRVAWLLI